MPTWAAAGFPYRLGRPEDHLCQPMTLNFSIAGVDPDLFDKHQWDIVPCWQEEQKKGYIQNPMDSIMVFHTTMPSIVRLNATRVVRRNPTDCWDITMADLEAREQIVELWEFLRDHIPGFSHSSIYSSAIQTGVRESRMIDGEHILTSEELVACTRFPDRIAAKATMISTSITLKVPALRITFPGWRVLYHSVSQPDSEERGKSAGRRPLYLRDARGAGVDSHHGDCLYAGGGGGNRRRDCPAGSPSGCTGGYSDASGYTGQGQRLYRIRPFALTGKPDREYTNKRIPRLFPRGTAAGSFYFSAVQ